MNGFGEKPFPGEGTGAFPGSAPEDTLLFRGALPAPAKGAKKSVRGRPRRVVPNPDKPSTTGEQMRGCVSSPLEIRCPEKGEPASLKTRVLWLN